MKVLSDFVSAVKARQADIAAGLVHGNAPDYVAYQRLVGENQGLESALSIINHLLNEDEDER